MENFVLLLILLLPLLSTASSFEAKPAKSFTVDLIHRDSPLSPLYNSSMTQSELLQSAAFRSISRSNNFHRHTPNNSAYDYGSKVQTRIYPNSGDYLMRIFLGTPPVKSLVVADTGSDLTWVQCRPCTSCYPQDAPIFNPKKSSTYKLQKCFSDSCELLLVPSCGPFDRCQYEERYGDKSVSRGELASDTISFDGTISTSYPNFLFGCGHNNSGLFETAGSGVAGLGPTGVSLIAQLGNQIGKKFSYCLNSPFSRSSTTSKLKFGSESTRFTEGLVTVPLVTDSLLSYVYLIELETISIGGTLVHPSEQFRIIVDAGTTLTVLQSGFFESVHSALLKHIDREPVRNPPEPYNLCYHDNGEIFPFPGVILNFAGANKGLRLRAYHTFKRFRGMFCLLIIPTDYYDDYSILGNMAQVNFEMQYDLENNQISFAPANCLKE